MNTYQNKINLLKENNLDYVVDELKNIQLTKNTLLKN